MVELKATLLKSSDLSKKVDETTKLGYPEPSPSTKGKGIWLQGIVVNCTQFKLGKRSDPYFNSGRYETSPSDVNAWSIGQFTVVKKDNAFMTGASGGNGFDLQLQSGIDLHLSFGWTAPVAGAYKSSVVESITCSDAYNKAKENGNKITSKNEYQGVDSDDNAVSIKFEVACTGGQRPVYTVTQVII